MKVAGISAYTVACGDEGVPGAYGKVSMVLDWLKQSGVLEGEALSMCP